MDRHICIYCGSLQISKTVQYMVCNACGACIDKTYDTDFFNPDFTEVNEYSQPLFNDNNKSIEAVEKLISFTQVDIGLNTKHTLIADTTILKNSLKKNNLTYPSEYFLAASVIISDRFNVDANSALEYLSSDFTSRHEQMLKKTIKITRGLWNGTRKEGFCLALNVSTELNNQSSNYIDIYIDEFWNKKINQVNKIKMAAGKNKSISEILQKAKLSRSGYYRARTRLNGKFILKNKKYPLISPNIGIQIIELKNKGYSAKKIQVEIAIINLIDISHRTISRFLRDL